MAKNTSLMINRSLQIIENQILEQTLMPKTVLHRKALKNYFESDTKEIEPRLLIQKDEAGYLERDAKEQVYLTDEERTLLKAAAQEYNTDMGTIFFHALLIYCSILAPVVIGTDNFDYQK